MSDIEREAHVGEPCVIRATAARDGVWVGDPAVGLFQLTPGQARRLACDLLTEADRAEGNPPSHIYQVDAR